MEVETRPTNAAAPESPRAGAPHVAVENLRVKFVDPDVTVHAVNGVSFEIGRGEVLCILGESGSGKSVTLRALMRLLPPRKTRIEGRVQVAGRDILALPAEALRRVRGPTVAMIFQEPMTALDPVFTIGEQITEVIRAHDGMDLQAARRRALELLNLVQIPSAERRLGAYPHQLSGGLRQRAMIAIALACRPELLLADEPTTALDATVQIQVLLLLRSLQRELGMSMAFVTHDLGVAAEVAHRVAVMYAGRFVELGPVNDIVKRPRHPYTQGLLAANVHNVPQDTRLTTIPGAPPDLASLPPGCSFAARCTHAVAACRAALPPEVDVGPAGTPHLVRCIRETA